MKKEQTQKEKNNNNKSTVVFNVQFCYSLPKETFHNRPHCNFYNLRSFHLMFRFKYTFLYCFKRKRNKRFDIILSFLKTVCSIARKYSSTYSALYLAFRKILFLQENIRSFTIIENLFDKLQTKLR
jgi:hypothetical protein